jgi:hypothetical protein
MPSEIRVDASKNTSGLGTITYTNTGAIVSGGITASGPVTVETSPFIEIPQQFHQIMELQVLLMK